MISIFTFKEYVTPERRKFIFPLLLDLCYLSKGILLNYYRVVEEIEMADIVVVPVDIKIFFREKKSRELKEMIQLGHQKGKPVWVYSAGDIGKTLDIAGIFTFRFGGFDSKLDNRTYILPALISDPFKIEGYKPDFQSLQKVSRPQIGFVGHAHDSKLMLIREFLIYVGVQVLNKKNKVLDYQPFFPTAFARYESLMKLKQSKRITTNFLLRKRYRAGAKTEKERRATSIEFLENIRQNPYIFCIRGSGNFSTRFYETLAMGRIPVLVNTDCRLPLPWVSWKDHCVITDFKNVEEDLLEFHSSVTEERFERIQIENRNFWQTHLTRESFFVQVHNHFLDKYLL